MNLSRRLAQRYAAMASAVATAATVGMLPAPAAAAPGDVAFVVRVKIDEVGWLLFSERPVGQPFRDRYYQSREGVPLNQWIEHRGSLPAGSTVYFAEADSYISQLRDSELITIRAGQTQYTVDLTVRQSGPPDNRGILG